mmetsp:Transcript_92536/g.261955  ORF Transcript_92536/g.261955 Transcript_92536/m.261955 type:complete len:204 (+) Transcript_92536:709-1320(+)
MCKFYTAAVEALCHIQRSDACHFLHKLPIHDIGVSVEQRRLGQDDMVEVHPDIVQVVPSDLLTGRGSEANCQTWDQFPIFAQFHEERVGPVRLAADPEVRGDDAQLGLVGRGDPVLRGTLVGGVQDEGPARRVPVADGVYDEARVDTGEPFCERKAAQLAFLLVSVEQRDLLRTADGGNVDAKEVVVRGEAEEKTIAENWGKF